MTRTLLCLALIGAATPAFAHAHLLKSSPAPGSHIRAPRHVTLTFSEALEPAFSGALLMDSDGRNFNGAPVKVDGSVMTLTPERLAPGRYHVSWHAVGHDTHRTEGEISFIVVK